MQYNNIKKYIYKLDPERAHTLVESGAHAIASFAPFLLSAIRSRFTLKDERLSQNIFNVNFPNPVGMAAGFDKNATMIPFLEALGFGYIEYGTVTPRPQEGNPKPRLFRFPEEESLQNAMGFNNDGMTKIKARVAKLYPYTIPLGANIGKNKTTTEVNAIKDYEILINTFKDLSDYIVINISSPNTPGLRDLQNESFIRELFTLSSSLTTKPVLLKIAPDLDPKDATQICGIALENGAKGIIATNTTIDYSLLPNAKGFGGVSGKVLKEKSFQMFETIAETFYKDTTLISVGGISDGDEAYRRIKAGASLVQVYSAFIFKGPSLAKNINQRLLELIEKDGFNNIAEAVGADRS
jgi:dihydroorotate dehydrogenase